MLALVAVPPAAVLAVVDPEVADAPEVVVVEDAVAAAVVLAAAAVVFAAASETATVEVEEETFIGKSKVELISV